MCGCHLQTAQIYIGYFGTCTTFPQAVCSYIFSLVNCLQSISYIVFKCLHRNNLNAMSDILRLALLFKYSGVYLDNDMISLHSIEQMEGNAVIVEKNHSKSAINNGFLKFSKGNPLLFFMLQTVVCTLCSMVLLCFNVPRLENIFFCAHFFSATTLYA